jgi:hypothetical protein
VLACALASTKTTGDLPIVRDKLPFVPAGISSRVAFAALDGVQVAFRPEEQVAGIAVLFVAFCDGLGIDHSQLIDATRRRMNHDDTFFKRELKALRDYIQGELAP